MKKLINKTKNKTIANEVIEAKSFLSRAKGLIGRSSLNIDSVIWIHKCNSIHTWFMKFVIDAVFVDKNLVVKAIYPNLKPWRITRLLFSSKSVFEFSAGKIEKEKIEIGDQLYVGD